MFKLATSKSAQWAFALMAFYFGVMFLMASWVLGMSAVAPTDYGDLATSFEIKAMAGVQMAGAMAVLMGLLINGHWRWSALLRLSGCSVIVALCLMLAASSFMAENGWPVGIYCTGFAGFGLAVAWWNLVDFRAAVLFPKGPRHE